MSSQRVTDVYPQRKRTAHQAKDSPKASTSKTITDGGKSSQTDLDTLKQFDLTLEYGPCIGISRMERWERAEKHGLNPPKKVRDIINKHSNEETYEQCLWNDYNVLK